MDEDKRILMTNDYFGQKYDDRTKLIIGHN